MKVIVLIAYLAAIFVCTLGADKTIAPKWTHVISSTATNESRTQSLASRATCDIKKFEKCMRTFFRHLGMTSKAPKKPPSRKFELYFSTLVGMDPQGFKKACSYLSALSKCAPPSDCWKVDSIKQLLRDGQKGAFVILSMIWPYQYMCTKNYQTALSNWKCIIRAESQQNPCHSSGSSCKNVKAYLTCIRKLYTKKCKKAVGKMICRAEVAFVKAIAPNLCKPKDFDKACKKLRGLNDRF
uniref:Secreted protein n=1 Tax=Plectus sambesii TaxID=2011161 RepID=A0A914WUW4_9BILA